MAKRRKVVIMGAAGRDFHNFNVFFRDNPDFEVVAFTQTQIPEISDRIYPPELAGKLYPQGIPLIPEKDLPKIIREKGVDLVVFSYSDISLEYLMERASIALANGASFMLLGPKDTMLESEKPVIAVTAVRTGAGKSSVSRKLAKIFRKKGIKIAAIRHPMPYAKDLSKKVVECFKTMDDAYKKLVTGDLSIEELEEFEHYLQNGFEVWSGIDYEKILREAEKNADVILWDGGNNDFPFIKPDLMITVADALRPGHELTYFPGSVNIRMCDVVLINKIGPAPFDNWKAIIRNVQRVNPKARIILAESQIRVEDPSMIRDKRVLVIEDGPTVTHGEADLAAGLLAARMFGAREVVDPRPYVPKDSVLEEIYGKYPHLGKILPTIGYNKKQVKVLLDVINRVKADVIVSGTPVTLSRIFEVYGLNVSKPIVQVKYDIVEVSGYTLENVVDEFIENYLRG